MSAPVPTNAQIVLTAEHRSLSRLAERRPRFVSARESVPATVANHHVAESGFEQVVLVPVRELKPLTRHVLRFDDSEPGDAEPLAFETRGGADSSRPNWNAPARVASVERVDGRCGPAVRAVVAVDVVDDSKVLLAEVDVTRVGGARPISFLLPIVRGEVVLSREGAAPFVFHDRVAYDVRIRAVDQAGNRTSMPGSALRLVGPPPMTKTAALATR